MHTEITAAHTDTNETAKTEKRTLSLARVKVEEAKSEPGQMPGMDYPAGLLISD